MSGFSRAIVGILGGFAASTSKVLALDVERLGRFVETGNLDDMTELRVTIFIFTPLLMLLGGIVAWASGEEQRMKLLAIGCAAPALLAPWTVGEIDKGPLSQQTSFSIITPAYAQEVDQSADTSTFSKGLKALFGLSNIEEQNYWVIVGSTEDKVAAESYASEINKIDPDLEAFVGKQKPGNNYYPVIIGGTDAYSPFAEASALRDKATSIPIISQDSYLSDYPDR